jgi:hypothetical protein
MLNGRKPVEVEVRVVGEQRPGRRRHRAGPELAKQQAVHSGAPVSVRRQVRIRRSQAIRCYIGPNGSGKSLCAVVDLMPSLDRGRKVLSTVPLYDWRATPDLELYELDQELGVYVHAESGAQWRRPLHPGYVRLNAWSQLIEAEACDVFLDDVAGFASSRQTSNMPAATERLLQKLRHEDMTLSWTAPAWARADLVIRETTMAVTVCKGSRPVREEQSDRLWLRNQFFDWTTYDASEFAEWTDGRKERVKRLARQSFRGPGSDAFNAYDSLGRVDTISTVTDAGRCVDCGGTRRAPACSCPDYVHRLGEAAAKGTGARQRSARAGADGTEPVTGHLVGAGSASSVSS